MATVLERFDKLGLARSKHVLSKAGELVSDRWKFYSNTFNLQSGVSLKTQIEDGVSIEVNNYPDSFVPLMDEVILSLGNGGEGLRNG